jgi:hypothetical protein
MSDAIYPAMRGLTWPVKRTVEWNSTVQQSSSGKEVLLSSWQAPIWHWELIYEYLPDSGTPPTDYRTLVDFFSARQGKFDSFLYLDPDDNSVTNQVFGTGDAANTVFQLTRTLASGFPEPIQNINVLTSISVNDWQDIKQMVATSITNMAIHSQVFDGYAGAALVVANTDVAPDGTTTASNISDASISVFLARSQSWTVPANGSSYCFSIYVKKTSSATNSFGVNISYSGGSTTSATPRLNTNTGNIWLGGCSFGGATDCGAFWRFWGVKANNSTNTTLTVSIQPAPGLNVGANPDTSDDSTVTGAAVIWGLQVELGTSYTRYIATTTVAVTVTDYTLTVTGQVVFLVAPALGAALTWTGTYFWRCRFEEDLQDFEQFMATIWEAKTVKIKSVKL